MMRQARAQHPGPRTSGRSSQASNLRLAGPDSACGRSSPLSKLSGASNASLRDNSPAGACRQGNDRGRSVSAWGFWGDILNSPYHCFGTACEDPALFRVSNQRFVHTSVDVAERNVEVNA